MKQTTISSPIKTRCHVYTNMKRLLAFCFLVAMTLGLMAQPNHSIVTAKELPTNPFGHPLIPDLVADPSIVDIDGTFYCYVTTDGYGQGLRHLGLQWCGNQEIS